jgi:hypothetical protein
MFDFSILRLLDMCYVCEYGLMHSLSYRFLDSVDILLSGSHRGKTKTPPLDIRTVSSTSITKPPSKGEVTSVSHHDFELDDLFSLLSFRRWAKIEIGDTRQRMGCTFLH